MATFHSGKYADAYVGTNTANVELPITGWTAEESQEVVSFRNSKTGRYTVAEGTFVTLNVTLSMDYDFSANPYLNANGGLSIINNGTMAGRLYVGGNSTPTSAAFWDCPAMILQSTSHSLTVEGKPTLSHKLLATGTFTEPAS